MEERFHPKELGGNISSKKKKKRMGGKVSAKKDGIQKNLDIIRESKSEQLVLHHSSNHSTGPGCRDWRQRMRKAGQACSARNGGQRTPEASPGGS